jgi:hypothetical protein
VQAAEVPWQIYLNVVHQVERSNVVVAHELVFVGTGGAIEA